MGWASHLHSTLRLDFSRIPEADLICRQKIRLTKVWKEYLKTPQVPLPALQDWKLTKNEDLAVVKYQRMESHNIGKVLSWKCFQQYFLCLLSNSWHWPLTGSGKGINFWLLAWTWEHLCLLGHSLLQGIIYTRSSINCWYRSDTADCKLFWGSTSWTASF